MSHPSGGPTRWSVALSLALAAGCDIFPHEGPGVPDNDGDGYDTIADCNDTDPSISPGADELCNGRDDDCDGAIDEEDVVDAPTWYADTDGDGFGDAATATVACVAPSGFQTDDRDCDDDDPAIRPGATELCDGVDNDCDGVTDEDDAADAPTWYADDDDDGYGNAATAATACAPPSGTTADYTDCDDTDEDVNPAAKELCNGVDDDCDGVTDEDDAEDAPLWFADADADGYGDHEAPWSACAQPSGFTADDSDCDDGDAAVNPAATELCDGVDNDCDATVDATGLITLDGAANYPTIAEAIADADAGSSVLVCDGTYAENLEITQDLTLASLNGAVTTILDGGGSGGIIHIDGATVLIDGFALTGGTGTYVADFDATYGGAVLVSGAGPLTIEGCNLQGNDAENGGGLTILDGATITITDSSVTANTATSAGGGALLGASATLTSVNTDWGSDGGDNSPDDVYFDITYSGWGAGASFTCEPGLGCY